MRASVCWPSAQGNAPGCLNGTDDVALEFLGTGDEDRVAALEPDVLFKPAVLQDGLDVDRQDRIAADDAGAGHVGLGGRALAQRDGVEEVGRPVHEGDAGVVELAQQIDGLAAIALHRHHHPGLVELGAVGCGELLLDLAQREAGDLGALDGRKLDAAIRFDTDGQIVHARLTEHIDLEHVTLAHTVFGIYPCPAVKGLALRCETATSGVPAGL